MKKIAIFALLLGVNLVHANDVCNEYIKQSKLYLDELYAKESKRLANDEKALRLFELKFDEFKKELMGATNLKGKNFFMPLRALLTNDLHGPELSELYPLIKDDLAKILI